MAKHVNASTLARRAKNERMSSAMTKSVETYGCKVYHTSSEKAPNDEEFAPHFMLEGIEEDIKTDRNAETKSNIDASLALLEVLYGYAEGARFPLEDGRTFVVLTKVKVVKDED